MYVIPEHKFCYLAHPRTASKATSQALLSIGAIKLGSHHDTPAEHPGFIKPDWLVCSTVRNHWDTMVSWWYKISTKQPLRKFIPEFIDKNPKFVRNNSLWWMARPYTNQLLFYENLQTQLNEVLETRGMATVVLPRVVDSRRSGRYQLYYDQVTRAWVASYFKEEIEQYKYRYGD